ncbi:MAG: hypothetical protein HFF09_01075 [Oscillospiraceae bacterium]|nr:hypothetical protein [Oscillospiraceae bacterium]
MNESTKKKIQKVFWVTVIIVCTVICILLVPQMEPFKIAQDKEKPVIVGVKEHVTVEVPGPEFGVDYDLEDIEVAVLAGVTAEDNLDKGSRAPRIHVYGYDDMGNELTEFPPGTYRIVYRCNDRNKNEAEPVEALMTITAAGWPGL